MNDASDDLIQALFNTGNWSKTAARRGVRAGFKCEYCDRDLLASVDDFKEWQEDHIIPLSDGGLDDDENIAVACRTCNVNVKARWSPKKICHPDASRDELIAAVRLYVATRRTKFLADVLESRKIVYPEPGS